MVGPSSMEETSRSNTLLRRLPGGEWWGRGVG